MKKRIAKKIEKRINAGAACPRRNGRGYTEGTRAKACALLYPQRNSLSLRGFGPSHIGEFYATWAAFDAWAQRWYGWCSSR